MLKAICAVDLNGGIAKDGELPWGMGFKKDLAMFSELTRGHDLIVGRKTDDTLPDKGLPFRRLIVLSQSEPETKRQGRVYVSSVKEIEDLLLPHRTVWVIGGSQIYELIDYELEIMELYLNVIEDKFPSDTKLSLLNKIEWQAGDAVLRKRFKDGPNETQVSSLIVRPHLKPDFRNTKQKTARATIKGFLKSARSLHEIK